jgi:hypothetical protein
MGKKIDLNPILALLNEEGVIKNPVLVQTIFKAIKLDMSLDDFFT